jgi:hypothetical protein
MAGALPRRDAERRVHTTQVAISTTIGSDFPPQFGHVLPRQRSLSHQCPLESPQLQMMPVSLQVVHFIQAA